MTVSFILPNTKGKPVTTDLSVLESGTAISVSKGLWIFKDIQVDKLVSSLQAVVDSMPYLTGTLTLRNNFNPFNGRITIFQPQLSYYNDKDPGVRLETAKSGDRIDEILADVVVDSNGISQPLFIDGYLDQRSIAKFDRPPAKPGSLLSIKMTEFACRAVGIGMAINHGIGDAQSLKVLLSVWSLAYHGNRITNPPLYLPNDVNKLFESLDSTASGTSNGLNVRFFNFLTSSRLIEEFSPLLGSMIKVIKEKFRIEEFDGGDRNKETLCFKFSPQDIEKIHGLVVVQEDNDNLQVNVSRMNSFVAFLWDCVIKARVPQVEDEVFSLYHAVGLRDRLPSKRNMNFGDRFGSFAIAGFVKATQETSTIEKAIRIRKMINSLNKDNIPSMLRTMYHQLCPFVDVCFSLGRNNTVVTTWIDNKSYPINFGELIHFSRTTRALESDGYMIISAETGDSSKRWYENGATMTFSAPKPVLTRLSNELKLFRKTHM